MGHSPYCTAHLLSISTLLASTRYLTKKKIIQYLWEGGEKEVRREGELRVGFKGHM